jgi:hypothetical protein
MPSFALLAPWEVADVTRDYSVEFVSRLAAQGAPFETENAVFTAHLEIGPKDLPKYMFYQRLAAVSSVPGTIFLLQCRTRGARFPPQTEVPALLLTAGLRQQPYCLEEVASLVLSPFEPSRFAHQAGAGSTAIFDSFLCVSAGGSLNWLTPARASGRERDKVPSTAEVWLYQSPRERGTLDATRMTERRRNRVVPTCPIRHRCSSRNSSDC